MDSGTRTGRGLFSCLLCATLAIALLAVGSWLWLFRMESVERGSVARISSRLAELHGVQLAVERRIACSRGYLMTRDRVPHAECAEARRREMSARLARIEGGGLDETGVVRLREVRALAAVLDHAFARTFASPAMRRSSYQVIAGFEEQVMPARDRLGAALERMTESERSALRAIEGRHERFKARAFGLFTLLIGILAALLLALGLAMMRSQRALAAGVRSRDEFISIASHELKTPVAALKLQLQVLQRLGCVDPDKLASQLGRSTANAERLSLLIDKLLDVARFRSGQMAMDLRREDLSALAGTAVSRFVEGLAPRDRPDVRFRGEPDVEVEADGSRIEQVVVNLLSNAVKYARGSLIEVEVSRVDGNFARLVVRDHGPGIPAGVQARLFDAFERGEQEAQPGLGLGLFVVRSIARCHGGWVGVESAQGQGASFVVVLPALPARIMSHANSGASPYSSSRAAG